MKWASVLKSTEGTPSSSATTDESYKAVVKELSEQLMAELGGAKPDFLLAFISPDYKKQFEAVVTELNNLLMPGAFIGCTAGGLIGGGQELEQQSAITLTGAVLPGVKAHAFHVTNDFMPDLDDPPQSWERLLDVTAQDQPSFVLLCDPFSFSIENFVQGLDYAFPKCVKVGGLASGGHKAGENRMIADDRVYRSGLVGVYFSGNIEVDAVVAQGCRLIGKPHHVTKCDANLLYELDGKPAFMVLKEEIDRLSERDQKLAREAIFLGVAMDEFKDNFSDGDFLIRNIYGIEPMSGALLVGEQLRSERTVQFHLRDAASSADDLRSMLQRYTEDHTKSRTACGALLFSCLGRGQYLYGRANHDSELFGQYLGQIPLGGFFCNGEIGPVGNSTFLHGYTSSFGIFRESLSTRK
ncbi:MAG: FIST C-terminal domain-containing protein [Cyanobacteria bacterium SZAS LIN-3]|nr:FIST C-terminal domain-containing protein [Cyanobacteria bacterium SZAS LIN-3]